MADCKSRRLVESLTKDILGGKYGAGKPFPSVRALIRRTGLSNTTVLHALDELAHLGLISRRQGSGTFVKRHTVSRKIGLIVPGVAVTDFFKPVVSEINRLAKESGYELHSAVSWSALAPRRSRRAIYFFPRSSSCGSRRRGEKPCAEALSRRGMGHDYAIAQTR